MSVSSINYSTGWYSISPAFAWWNFDTNRMAEIQARKEAKRVTECNKRKEAKDSKIITQKKSIDIYA